jgi:hypothetical protein
MGCLTAFATIATGVTLLRILRPGYHCESSLEALGLVAIYTSVKGLTSLTNATSAALFRAMLTVFAVLTGLARVIAIASSKRIVRDDGA